MYPTTFLKKTGRNYNNRIEYNSSLFIENDKIHQGIDMINNLINR